MKNRPRNQGQRLTGKFEYTSFPMIKPEEANFERGGSLFGPCGLWRKKSRKIGGTVLGRSFRPVWEWCTYRPVAIAGPWPTIKGRG